MASNLLQLRDVFTADRLARPDAAPPPAWDLATTSGRLVEIGGQGSTARLSLAFRLVREAQLAGEPTVWIGVRVPAFYPPDVAASGVDLAALPLVVAPDVPAAVGAATRLARSGAIGVLVVDLVDAGRDAGARVPVGGLTRLVGLAQTHGIAIVFLTDHAEGQSSIHSLISLRGQGCRLDGRVGPRRVQWRALKDKRSGPGWTQVMTFRPPEGLW